MVRKLREQFNKQLRQTNQKPSNKFKNNPKGSEPPLGIEVNKKSGLTRSDKAFYARVILGCVLIVAGLGFIAFKEIERRKTELMYAEKCLMHNDTTIKINRKTDGKIAKSEELESCPGGMLINEHLIDFVNETHAISTEKLPDNVKLSLVPDGCSYEWAAGYAATESSNRDRGIYLKSPPEDAWDLENIYHEIGHLQPGGYDNEVIAELNGFEHALMGYVLISNQPDSFVQKKFSSRFLTDLGLETDEGDATAWWSKYFVTVVMADLYVSVDLVQSGLSLGDYRKADIFIFNKLVELEGDFAALRNEVIELRRNGELLDAIDSEVVKFTDEYSGESNESTCFGKINKELKHAYYLELKRRFKPSIAAKFLHDSSFFPDPDNISVE